ncbi:MAG: hypothetical protein JXR70_05800 [Spirochaetales bacterium]|nr:hypothetical protein [Spirochaetales bacterium]
MNKKNDSLTQEKREISFRPLYLLERLLDQTDYLISYTYEDLVFIEHSHILFKFMDQQEEMGFYINSSLDQESRDRIRHHMSQKAEKERILLFYLGLFEMEQDKDVEEIKLRFF